MITLFQKVAGGFLLTLILTSCWSNKSNTPPSGQAIPEDTPVQIFTEDLGKTQTGFTSDLKNLVDSSYEQAVNSSGSTK